ncbi:four helix bundle protein, partial [Oligoflexia bacterium]|nr:four helix bundle protein [Oligoflexia bacterium]
YQFAIELLATLSQITHHLPHGYAFIADQLKRAAVSIPLNLAEGAGKQTPKDKKRFYGYARGSALECGAIIDCCLTMDIITLSHVETAKPKIIQVVKILSKMAR